MGILKVITLICLAVAANGESKSDPQYYGYPWGSYGYNSYYPSSPVVALPTYRQVYTPQWQYVSYAPTRTYTPTRTYVPTGSVATATAGVRYHPVNYYPVVTNVRTVYDTPVSNTVDQPYNSYDVDGYDDTQQNAVVVEPPEPERETKHQLRPIIPYFPSEDDDLRSANGQGDVTFLRPDEVPETPEVADSPNIISYSALPSRQPVQNTASINSIPFTQALFNRIPISHFRRYKKA